MNKKEKVKNVDDVIAILLSKFKALKGEVGIEIRSINKSNLLYSDDVVLDAFNFISSISKEDLSDILEEDFKNSTTFANRVNGLLRFFARIIQFNPNADDLVEQTFKCQLYHKKSENIEFFTLIYGEEYAEKKLEKKANRVKGENNPGYNHGGKFSPFSKKFLNHVGKSEFEVEESIIEVSNKSKNTKRENPHKENTKIEYYIAQGFSEEESKILLSERQSTFSLQKCVEKYGEDEGTLVWRRRQIKWRNSIDNLSSDEKYNILRGQCKGAWNAMKKSVDGAFVYLMKSTKEKNLYKFGISTNVQKRKVTVSSEMGHKFEILKEKKFLVDDVLEKEDNLCKAFREKSLFEVKNETSFASLEYFYDDREVGEIIKMWESIIM